MSDKPTLRERPDEKATPDWLRGFAKAFVEGQRINACADAWEQREHENEDLHLVAQGVKHYWWCENNVAAGAPQGHVCQRCRAEAAESALAKENERLPCGHRNELDGNDECVTCSTLRALDECGQELERAESALKALAVEPTLPEGPVWVGGEHRCKWRIEANHPMDAVATTEARAWALHAFGAMETRGWHGLGEGFVADLALMVAPLFAERDRHRRWHRQPTHGSCCTCQHCGLFYDECRCGLDEVADELEKAQAEVADLRARLEAMQTQAQEIAASNADHIRWQREAQARLEAAEREKADAQLDTRLVYGVREKEKARLERDLAAAREEIETLKEQMGRQDWQADREE